MKSKLLMLLFFAIPFGVFSQTISGKITDIDSKNALAFANVTISSTEGTVSDAEGHFSIKIHNDTKSLRISYIGYETIIVNLIAGKTYYNISLKATSKSLTEVVVSSDFEDPAITLIKKVIKNKPKNDYRKKLDKYSFIKYYKFLVTAEPDSINGNLDTIYHNGVFHAVDSSLYEFKKDLSDKDMFVMESVMKVNATNGDEKHKVIASRTAGFKNPMYEMLAMQVSTHNVYDDRYKILIKEYLGPITRLSIKKYLYEIEEDIIIQGRGIHVLSYKKNANPLISGKIFIDQKTFAIAKMTLNTYEQFELQTTHDFNYHSAYDTWFPVDAKMKIRKAQKKNSLTLGDGFISVTGREDRDSIKHTNELDESDYLFAKARTKYLEVNIGNLHEDKIKYNLQVAPTAYVQTKEFWAKYRDEDRAERELKTYEFIDSIGKEIDLEKNINIFRKAVKGYYPAGPIDLDIARVTDVNRYEGFRVSLGGKTNEKVSNRFNIEAYFAYGFRDKEEKYHGQFNYKFNHLSQSFLHVGYTKDLDKTASFSSSQDGFFHGALSDLSSDKYYMSKTINVGLSRQLTNTMGAKLTFESQDINLKHKVFYISPTDAIDALEYKDIKRFKLSMTFDPFSKFYLAPTGRELLSKGFPRFYIDIEKSVPSWSHNNYDYYRLSLQVDYKKTYLNKYYTEASIKLGYANDHASFIHLFSPNTGGYEDLNKDWYKKIHVRINPAFETMDNLEFVNHFVSTLQLKHTFSKIKVTKRYYFDLSLIGRMAYGTGESLNYYQVTAPKSLDKGYYEAGLELNRLYKVFKQGVGLGFYYRLGEYAHPDPLDNFAIRLTFTSANILGN